MKSANRSPKKLSTLRKMPLILAGTVGFLAVLGALYMIHMPGKSYSGHLPSLTEEESDIGKNLESHVRKLAGDIGERNLWKYEALEASAAHIQDTFRALGYESSVQEFPAEGRAFGLPVVGQKTVKNVEAELPGRGSTGEIIVVGAHYDSVIGSPGANDNATGVAAVLELARLLRDSKPKRTFRFVAFVNEEPPFFQTEAMGSRVYARRCKQRGEKIVAMFSLETVGFYSDARGSQKYPFPLSLFYPSTGNFVGFVGNVASGSLVRRAIRLFRQQASFPSEGAAVPGWLTGIGWSDHWSFWKEGFPGVMITDTAFCRYPHYHMYSDTPDKVDYERLARVVGGLEKVIRELGGH